MKKKILIVDDDKEFLEELNETLLLSGYDVSAVSEATQAFGVASEIKPDVILLDLKMKGMTGFEVASKLKSFPQTMGIPIIAMSGFFTENEDSTLLSFFNIQNYLNKPFNPLNAIDQIETILKATENK